MDAKKTTTKKAPTGGAASQGTKKPTPGAVKKVKKVKKKKGTGEIVSTEIIKKEVPKKPAKKSKTKDDDFKLMSMDEIEDMFAAKEKAFQKRIKEFHKVELQPLTLKLIFKHAFPKPEEPKLRIDQIEEEMKKVEKAEEEATEHTESTSAQTKVEATESKPDDPPQESSEEEKEEEEKKQPVDQETIKNEEKKKIEDVLRQSQSSFMKKALQQEMDKIQNPEPPSVVEQFNQTGGFSQKGGVVPQKTEVAPTITRKLGVGLAAVIAQRKAAALKAKQEQERKEEEEKAPVVKAPQPLSDDDSYYDEEEDSYYDGSDGEEKIGKGFDEEDGIDLEEITEEDVQQKKLQILQEKLEDDYQKGFDAHKDPEKLITLKNLRLTFLNIGPGVESLEFFENLENLFLQQNHIEFIGVNAFQFNLKLQMLNLAHNRIGKIEGLSHLPELAFLDLSHNEIEEYAPGKELPKSLIILRMNDNPVSRAEDELDCEYRRKAVVALDQLIELDKIKVIAAERMLYKGMLPKGVKFQVRDKLEQFKRERQEEQAREQMEFELFKEMMEEQGESQVKRITDSLDEFARINEQDQFESALDGIMGKMKHQRASVLQGHAHRLAMIKTTLNGVLQKYPGSAARKDRRKAELAMNQAIQESEKEDDEGEEEIDFDTYSRQLDSEMKALVVREQGRAHELTESQLAQARGELEQPSWVNTQQARADLKEEAQINSFVKAGRLHAE